MGIVQIIIAHEKANKTLKTVHFWPSIIANISSCFTDCLVKESFIAWDITLTGKRHQKLQRMVDCGWYTCVLPRHPALNGVFHLRFPIQCSFIQIDVAIVSFKLHTSALDAIYSRKNEVYARLKERLGVPFSNARYRALLWVSNSRLFQRHLYETRSTPTSNCPHFSVKPYTLKFDDCNYMETAWIGRDIGR